MQKKTTAKPKVRQKITKVPNNLLSQFIDINRQLMEVQSFIQLTDQNIESLQNAIIALDANQKELLAKINEQPIKIKGFQQTITEYPLQTLNNKNNPSNPQINEEEQY